MHRQQHHTEHGCGSASRGPEIFYGYCHDTRQMRMMNYADFMNNLQAGYSNLYNNPVSGMQPMLNALSAMAQGGVATQRGHQGHHHHEHECCCGCGCHEDDCGCSCCIRCADVVEYARCGETRRIPLVFDNDTRRERDITLQLGNFATESGLDVAWKAAISPTEFKLAPCGRTTVVLSVQVDCGKLIAAPAGNDRRIVDVESCKVAYATLRAEGCTICPLVIAIAVLPERCDAHHTNCFCSCCN
jgi:hypothetical protein